MNTAPIPMNPMNQLEIPSDEAPSRYDPKARGNPGDVEIPNRIFVKGFSKDATDEEIKTFFQTYGIVRDTKIVRDKNGASKGYAFVTFDSQEVAEKVKDIERMKSGDRDIVIGAAKIRKKRPVFGRFAGFQKDFVPMGYPMQTTIGVTHDGVHYFPVALNQYNQMPFAQYPQQYAPMPQCGSPQQMQQLQLQPLEQMPSQYMGQQPVYQQMPPQQQHMQQVFVQQPQQMAQQQQMQQGPQQQGGPQNPQQQQHAAQQQPPQYLPQHQQIFSHQDIQLMTPPATPNLVSEQEAVMQSFQTTLTLTEIPNNQPPHY